VVPAGLATSQLKYFGEAGRVWVAGLPALATSCFERWELEPDGVPMFGALALVLPVRRADGSAAALKLQPVDDETRGEPAALRAWAGVGAVRLFEHDPASGSMLLQRLDADRCLQRVPDDLVALEVIVGLLARLHAVAPPTGLRRLADLAPTMLAEVPRVAALVADPDERRLFDTCAAHLRAVASEPIAERLLHWDLHYSNVLAALDPTAADQPHLAIDPKPLVGDPAFDLLPALWNRWDDIVATGHATRAVLRRFDLMTEALELDRDRARSWTLARVLQNALSDFGRLGATAFLPPHRHLAEALLGRSLRS